jgi:hypothetical protein
MSQDDDPEIEVKEVVRKQEDKDKKRKLEEIRQNQVINIIKANNNREKFLEASVSAS